MAIRLLDCLRTPLTHLLAHSFAGSLIRWLTHSLAPHCLLVRSAVLIPLLALSRGHGEIVFVHDLNAFISYSFNPQWGGWGVTELKGMKRRRGNNRGKGEHTRKKRKKVLPKKVFYFPEKRSFSAWVLWIFYRFIFISLFCFSSFLCRWTESESK